MLQSSELNRASPGASELNRASPGASELNRASPGASELNQASPGASELNRPCPGAADVSEEDSDMFDDIDIDIVKHVTVPCSSKVTPQPQPPNTLEKVFERYELLFSQR